MNRCPPHAWHPVSGWCVRGCGYRVDGWSEGRIKQLAHVDRSAVVDVSEPRRGVEQ